MNKVIIIASLGILMIAQGLFIGIMEAKYCDELDMREYYENKECRRFIK